MHSHECSHTGCRPQALLQREDEPGDEARLGPGGAKWNTCVYECSHPDWRMSDRVGPSGTHIIYVAVLAGECKLILSLVSSYVHIL